MWKKIWLVIEKPFVVVGTVCSVISAVGLCLKTEYGLVVSGIALVLSLSILLCAIMRVLNRFLENKTSEDHKCISSFIKYKTDDGENIVFDTYKLIQVKCGIMQCFKVGFKWSGKDSDIQSDLQIIDNDSIIRGKADEYDIACLKLKKPALYNETTVIHFRSKSNDAERISIPKIEVCVKYPIEFIQINVLLGYKPDNYIKTARIERKKINSDLPQDYSVIGSVSFDNKCKQYSYCLIDPEPGYFYRLSWDRD